MDFMALWWICRGFILKLYEIVVDLYGFVVDLEWLYMDLTLVTGK